ncbi:DUF726-domain-containing protein [Bimuria novae-zelandiae CBS 107.79]|uniref:DUF726-domain-containing protein n=1 Tax=Bimuria novae-zelandiae CBS 107.79 TaxID=1447943 RepID=A0A6A5VQP7_9PLEO|nr:DUF726-domain-containing protein [Bimuria novae-zelandiae CBS 107.79]
MLYKVTNVISGAGPSAAKQDEGASLTSVLGTPALRVELALLVLLCTDAMRSDLSAAFDPEKTHETSSSTATPPPKSPQPPSATQDLISFDEPPNEAALEVERARRARQREVESTQMQGLKRGALTFFDKWRAGVMHRLCDVLCARGDVVRQAKAKRKQMMEETQKQKQSNSLLLDFEGDPFSTQTYAGRGKRKHGHYEVIETQILAFDEENRVLILHCLLLILLSLEHYPAHSRVLLLRLTSSLELETDVLAEHEKSIAQGLLATAASHMDAEESAKKQASNDATARRWKVGLAAVGGAVLIGVTGGLAAPLLAAGIGTVMGGLGLGVVSTYLGALAGSSVLVGSLFGAYGAKMTGRIMEQYAKEVQDFEFIPVKDPERPSAQRDHEWAAELDARDPSKREHHRLRVAIGISGWLNSPSDVNKPWEIIDGAGTEPFALRFELDAMLRMGNSLNDVLFSYAWDGMTYTIVSRTLLGALYAGLWPLGLVKVASVLDNPFSVALARADKAGKVLAHALMDGVQGKRPVTLMGYSIGARVIYSCLVELAEQNAFGLVEAAVLMGTPAPSDSKSWRKIRSVVSARVVNVYSTEDYILGFLYRSTKLEFGVAGLGEVKDVFGIENADMSKTVSGHDRYRYLVGSILTKIGFGDIDFNRVAEQKRALEVAERKKEQVRKHVKQHKKDSQQPDPSASGATEMVVAQQSSNSLVNVSGPPSSEPSPPAPEAPRARRPMIVQQRSGQQPFVQRQRPMPTHSAVSPTAPTASSSSTTPAAIDPAYPKNTEEPRDDPLHTDSPPASLPARQSFPSSSLGRGQLPTNTTPTAAAPPQRTNFTRPTWSSSSQYVEPEDQITMRDLDHDAGQKFSPPLEEMLRHPKNLDSYEVARDVPDAAEAPRRAPVIAMDTETPKKTPVVAVAEVNDEESEYESGSDFGELSMVEPEPLDFNDYGLM